MNPTPTPNSPAPVDIARLREVIEGLAQFIIHIAEDYEKQSPMLRPPIAAKFDWARSNIEALRNEAPALLDEVERLRDDSAELHAIVKVLGNRAAFGGFKTSPEKLAALMYIAKTEDPKAEMMNLLAERDKLREEVERLRASEAAMRLAILSRITLRESSDPGLMPIDYLAEQFPATVGHIPLNDWFNRLYRSVSPNAGTELLAERDKLREERDASLALSVKTSDEALKDVQKIAVERDSLRQQNEQLLKEIEALRGQLARRSEAQASGEVCQASNWINPSDDLPPRLLSVLVAGVLEGESQEAIHEAFHDGKRWRSVRGNGCDAWERFDSVRLWREMPKIDAGPTEPNTAA